MCLFCNTASCPPSTCLDAPPVDLGVEAIPLIPFRILHTSSLISLSFSFPFWKMGLRKCGPAFSGHGEDCEMSCCLGRFSGSGTHTLLLYLCWVYILSCRFRNEVFCCLQTHVAMISTTSWGKHYPTLCGAGFRACCERTGTEEVQLSTCCVNHL